MSAFVNFGFALDTGSDEQNSSFSANDSSRLAGRWDSGNPRPNERKNARRRASPLLGLRFRVPEGWNWKRLRRTGQSQRSVALHRERCKGARVFYRGEFRLDAGHWFWWKEDNRARARAYYCPLRVPGTGTRKRSETDSRERPSPTTAVHERPKHRSR